MECFSLSRADIPALIDHLGKFGEIVAPRGKGDVSFSFEIVQNSSDVVLDYTRTLLPLKKYFPVIAAGSSPGRFDIKAECGYNNMFWIISSCPFNIE